MTDLRLIVFDVDGTLVDSQGDILAAMGAAFDAVRLVRPARAEVLSIVGLSLPEAMAVLAPDHPQHHGALVDGYKSAYMDLRARQGAAESSPLYPGVRDVLEQLRAVDPWLLGIATGKSRRGLDKLLEGHGLQGWFVTEQVSDFHPSKPHPAMLEAALAEAGLDAGQAVMIGDTSYDMEMARAAGMFAIGVSWGYHDRARLRGADVILDDIRDLPGLLHQRWSRT